MAKMRFGAAMVQAIAARMHEDPRMTLIGSAYLLGPAGGHPLLDELREKYAHRIIDEPPIAESSVASLAIGAAMCGCRTLAHFGLAAFAMEAWSQLIHEAGVAHYQSNGQIRVPAVFTMMHGMNPMEHGQHNRSPYATLANCPGLEIVLASTPADIKGLMTSALRSDNPTVVMNHPALMPLEGEVPEEDYAIPFGQADIKREGGDISILATSHKVRVALAAADRLAEDGISAEVVDPRTIVPLDWQTILKSIRKTGRLAILDDSPPFCGFGAEVAARAAETAFDDLKSAVVRLSPPMAPIPAGSSAQAAFQIGPEQVEQAVLAAIA